MKMYSKFVLPNVEVGQKMTDHYFELFTYIDDEIDENRTNTFYSNLKTLWYVTQIT